MTNYYYDLPDDIRDYINKFIEAKNIIGIASGKFINRIINRKKMLKELVNKIEEDSFEFDTPEYIESCGGQRLYNPVSVDTGNGLKLLAKNITGRETNASVKERKFWKEVLTRVSRGLFLDQYSGGPGAVYWQISLDSYNIIYNKFKKYDVNFTLTAEEFEEQIWDNIYGELYENMVPN